MTQLLPPCNHFLYVKDAVYATEILLAKSHCLFQSYIPSLRQNSSNDKLTGTYKGPTPLL